MLEKQEKKESVAAQNFCHTFSFFLSKIFI